MGLGLECHDRCGPPPDSLQGTAQRACLSGPDFQRDGLKMVNTGHLVSSGLRPQNRILRCLYLLKARVAALVFQTCAA